MVHTFCHGPLDANDPNYITSTATFLMVAGRARPYMLGTYMLGTYMLGTYLGSANPSYLLALV